MSGGGKTGAGLWEFYGHMDRRWEAARPAARQVDALFERLRGKDTA